ncbi:recombinase-like helix-turn-helix domain-containing protein [Sphingomonas sp. IC081]|uniref:recombinase-like helix-turn-helix domain-containing protein n=1 Tax=Sphingomonas sp. IC081 TaxID=304378 RepID=UPI0011582912|nr:recombinase-like helix-turn-helix domain-containing protein [Sphingomonas sp. IC081]QDK35699.1 hypothetical protein DM450_23520 [Sphingomonas sp. IC081]
MHHTNPFLHVAARSEAKGGPTTIEEPKAVENIVFQTRGGPLDPFEDRLADELMTVFDGGAVELEDVVAGLNAAGSRDRAGAPWTGQSFSGQMAASADGLFAASEG